METSDEKPQTTKESKDARRIRYAKQCLIVLTASLVNISSGMIQMWPNVLVSHIVRDNSTIFGREIHFEPWQLDLLGSMTELGKLVGFLSAGFFLNLLGRRWSLMITAIPGVFGSALIAFSLNTFMIIAGRFLDGMTVGIGTVAVTVYASEITDVRIRGTLCMISTMLVQIGGIFNISMAIMLSWYYMSLICACSLLVHCLMVPTLHESPSFLAVTGRDEGALKVLRKLRGSHVDIHEELSYLQQQNQTTDDTQGCRGLLQKQHLQKIGLMSGMFFIQNFCGTQVLRMNATRQLQELELPMDEKFSTIMVIGLLFFGNFIMTTILDSFGRRRCIMISLVLVATSYISLGTFIYLLDVNPSLIETQKEELSKFAYIVQNSTLTGFVEDGSALISIRDWLPLLFLMLAALGQSLGIGPLVQILPAEMFPTKLRSQGTSVCMIINSLQTFTILQLFSLMQATLTQAGMYWLFAGVAVVGVIYTYFLLKETSRTRVG